MKENIYTFEMPAVVVKRTKEKLEIDNDTDYKIVEKRLFDFFVAAAKEPLDMLDKEADELWHVFLLATKDYREFCNKYLGKFIEHYPYESDKPLSDSEVEDLATKIVNYVILYREENDLIELTDGHYRYDNKLFNQIRNKINKD